MCVDHRFKFTTTELKRRVERLLRRGVNMPMETRLLLEKWVIEAEEKLLDADLRAEGQSLSNMTNMALAQPKPRDQ